MAQTLLSRHPWLERLIASPVQEVRALVEGDAVIHPFGRAEPSDAAATLFFGLAPDDPAAVAFDKGVLGALEFYRQQSVRLRGGEWDRNALAALDLMRVIQRLSPKNSVLDLHKRFSYWNNWVENIVVDRGLDLRREYWRCLALSQNIAAEDGLEPRRLLPFWLNICGESGPRGRYDDLYLVVGLLGLRRLPLDEDSSANEEASLFGLARWAVAQHPTKKQFLREWRVLEGAFPRDPSFWTPLATKVIAEMENELFHQTKRTGITFPAAQWWREEIDLGEIKTREFAGAVSLPDLELVKAILSAIEKSRPFQTVKSPIETLIAQHQRYASRTGDTYYLVRTACNIGKSLLETNGDEPERRAEKARDLARLTLRFETFDVFAWSLWHDALVALGQLEAAELVAWEAVRRFPEDPQKRNQLALFLSKEKGDDRNAEALLRETLTLFPTDIFCRTQLANILGREKEREFEARQILRDALAIDPKNSISIRMLQQLESGRPFGPARNRRAIRQSDAATDLVPPDIAATARARRALFLSKQGDAEALEEIRRVFSEDENFAYGRYVAAASGVIEATIADNSLPTAFLAAAREGSLEGMSDLRERASGPDAIVLSIARASMGDGGAQIEIQGWLNEPVNDNDPRAAGLHEIAARLTSSPPSDFLADLLAASLGITLAA